MRSVEHMLMGRKRISAQRWLTKSYKSWKTVLAKAQMNLGGTRLTVKKRRGGGWSSSTWMLCFES